MISTAPIISVIIPTYNRKEIVCEAIQSVLQQEPKNFEIIVVDDGSTDGTADFLQSLNLPITIIKKENGGVSSARNAGIKASRGPYIAFLDSDDLWQPDILKSQLDYLESHPTIPLVYTDQFIEVQGKILDQTRFARETVPPDQKTRFSLPGFVQHMPIHISSVMVKKEIFDEIGFFNGDLHIHEDTELWNRISQKYSFGYIEKPLAIFRWEKDQEHLLKEGYRQRFVNEGRKYMKAYESIKQGQFSPEEREAVMESYSKIDEIEEGLTLDRQE